MPTYLSGAASSELQCTGRVIHERRLPSGDLDYGIRFEQLLSLQRASSSQSPPSPT